jgi:hypothetical protein
MSANNPIKPGRPGSDIRVSAMVGVITFAVLVGFVSMVYVLTAL